MSPALPVLAQSIYWKQEDPGQTALFLAVIGGIALLAIVVGIARNGVSGAGLGGSGGGARSAGFSKSRFRKAARQVGMAEEDLRFLEDYAKALNVTSPETTLMNQAKLDQFFKDVFRNIEKNSESEAAADERKAILLAIREGLAARGGGVKSVVSTRQLGRNTPLTFITQDEENYPTLVVAIEPQALAVEPVRDPYGEPIRFRRGSKLTCYFYGKEHQGFQFVTKVLGFSTIGARETLLLAHSDSVSALPARKHVRRETKSRCVFYPVVVTTTKVRGKTKTNARVEGISFPGTVTDISAGGMGIQTANPLPAGQFLKIELEAGSATHVAFGKVVRMNKLRGTAGMMHIQFVKISRRALNAVMSFVFGYAD